MKIFRGVLFVFTIIFSLKSYGQTGKNYWDLGDSLSVKGEYQLSIDNYTKSMPFYQNDNEKLSQLYDRRAECERKLKNLSGALGDALKATSLDTNNGRAYWHLGKVYGDRKSHQFAIESYSKAIPFYSGNNEALSYLYDNRAEEEAELYLYKKVIEDDSIAIKLNPKNEFAYWHRADAYTGMHNYKLAVDDYSSTILYENKGRTKTLAILFDIRGYCQQKLKKYLESINDESYAIKLDPNNGLYFWDRALVYSDNGDYQLAVDDYTNAMPFYKDNGRKMAMLYGNRARNEISMKQLLKAIDDYNNAISLNPDNGEYYWDRGAAHTDNGDFKPAIGDYTKAMTFYPNDKGSLGQLNNNCALCCYFLKDYQKVIDYCTVSISLNPLFPPPYYYRAKVYLKKLNKKELAIEDFKKTIELDTTKKSVDYIFALFYTGDQDLAYKKMQQAILTTNSSSDLLAKYYNMACLLSLMNKNGEAEIYLKKCVDGGYPQGHILRDDDLDNLRNDAAYKSIMAVKPDGN